MKSGESIRNRPYPPAQSSVYYSVASQEDNLGDIVIRRNVLRWIEDSGCKVHVFGGAMPKDYVDALILAPSVTIHHSPKSFTAAWIRSSSRRRSALVYAPGPRVAVSTFQSAKSAAIMLAMTGITRLSGGPVLGVGGAVRGTSSLALRLHQVTASISTDYSVRDEVSSAFLTARSRLVPDVAFADSRPLDLVPDEPTLAISMRFDRKHDHVAIRSLIREACRVGLRPVLVTQVRRDQENHQKMANDLKIELCGWNGQSHTEQLIRIDHAYRNAAVVVSDRLHACIFGARHGAVIINAETAASSKLTSTLSTVYPSDEVSAPMHPGDYRPLLENLQARREAQGISTRRAAAILDRERLRLRQELSHSVTDPNALALSSGN